MTIGTGVDPAFSQFYVASGAGIFEKNGLDVEIKTAFFRLGDEFRS